VKLKSKVHVNICKGLGEFPKRILCSFLSLFLLYAGELKYFSGYYFQILNFSLWVSRQSSEIHINIHLLEVNKMTAKFPLKSCGTWKACGFSKASLKSSKPTRPQNLISCIPRMVEFAHLCYIKKHEWVFYTFFVQNTEFSQLMPLPLLEEVLLGDKSCLLHVVVTLLSFLPYTRIFRVECWRQSFMFLRHLEFINALFYNFESSFHYRWIPLLINVIVQVHSSGCTVIYLQYTIHDTKGHSRRDSSNLLKFEAPVGGVPSLSGPIRTSLYN